MSVAILFYNFGIYAIYLKEGKEIVLIGAMKEELFYGPRNCGEDRGRDEKSTNWILHLNLPLNCVVDANAEEKGWSSNIQLIVSGDDYKNKRTLLNHHATADGKVMLAITG